MQEAERQLLAPGSIILLLVVVANLAFCLLALSYVADIKDAIITASTSVKYLSLNAPTNFTSFAGDVTGIQRPDETQEATGFQGARNETDSQGAVLTSAAVETNVTVRSTSPAFAVIDTMMNKSGYQQQLSVTKSVVSTQSILLNDPECLSVSPNSTFVRLTMMRVGNDTAEVVMDKNKIDFTTATNQVLDICLGMLAYEGPKTIQRTMKTWMEAGLLDLVAEKIMFVQGPRDKPTSDYAKWVAFLRGLAAQYGFSVITSLSNIRFRALFNLSDACSATHFLFMEEDWVVTAEGFAGTAAIKEHVFNELSSATELLSTGLVDGIRFRSVRYGGDPNWAIDTWNNHISKRRGGRPGPVVVHGGAPNGRFNWGDKVPYSAYPTPDAYIIRDLGDDPPRLVRVTNGNYSSPLGPTCQVWLCQTVPITRYCMRSSRYDPW